jgi:hypothetical protein
MAVQPLLEPAEQPQRPVGELGRERAITRVELHVALEVGVERGRGVGLVAKDAHAHLGRNAAGRGGSPWLRHAPYLRQADGDVIRP